MNHDPINEASRRSTFMFCVSSYSYSSLNRRLSTVFENEQKMSHLNFLDFWQKGNSLRKAAR